VRYLSVVSALPAVDSDQLSGAAAKKLSDELLCGTAKKPKNKQLCVGI